MISRKLNAFLNAFLNPLLLILILILMILPLFFPSVYALSHDTDTNGAELDYQNFEKNPLAYASLPEPGKSTFTARFFSEDSKRLADDQYRDLAVSYLKDHSESLDPNNKGVQQFFQKNAVIDSSLTQKYLSIIAPDANIVVQSFPNGFKIEGKNLVYGKSPNMATISDISQFGKDKNIKITDRGVEINSKGKGNIALSSGELSLNDDGSIKISGNAKLQSNGENIFFINDKKFFAKGDVRFENSQILLTPENNGKTSSYLEIYDNAGNKVLRLSAVNKPWIIKSPNIKESVDVFSKNNKASAMYYDFDANKIDSIWLLPDSTSYLDVSGRNLKLSSDSHGGLSLKQKVSDFFNKKIDTKTLLKDELILRLGSSSRYVLQEDSVSFEKSRGAQKIIEGTDRKVSVQQFTVFSKNKKNSQDVKDLTKLVVTVNNNDDRNEFSITKTDKGYEVDNNGKKISYQRREQLNSVVSKFLKGLKVENPGRVSNAITSNIYEEKKLLTMLNAGNFIPSVFPDYTRGYGTSSACATVISSIAAQSKFPELKIYGTPIEQGGKGTKSAPSMDTELSSDKNFERIYVKAGDQAAAQRAAIAIKNSPYSIVSRYEGSEAIHVLYGLGIENKNGATKVLTIDNQAGSVYAEGAGYRVVKLRSYQNPLGESYNMAVYVPKKK